MGEQLKVNTERRSGVFSLYVYIGDGIYQDNTGVVAKTG